MSTTAQSPAPLNGRRALVTGASRGIGAAIARGLAVRGADLALTARSAAGLEALADELRASGSTVRVIPADLSDRSSLADLMNYVHDELGGLEILINNAGVLPEAVRAEGIGWASWDATIDVNLSAPWFLACRAKEMMGAGGVIVNVASSAAYYPSKGLAPYNVSKAGLLMLTRVLALEWAREKIRVVGVAPGKIDTGLIDPILRWTEKHDLALNPMNRIGAGSEVAELVAYLVSDAASYVTGVTIAIDGGELLATSAG